MFRFLLLFSVLIFQNIENLNAKHTDQNWNSFYLLHDWRKNVVLAQTERKQARTAVLIIAPPSMEGNCERINRWKLGKKVWEQYMNSHPNVDCYFIQSTFPQPERENVNQVWIEGNTIYVGDSWYEKYGSDRILHKTIDALESLLPKYTHFIRTNLNIFLNLTAVNEYMETHHQSFFTTPIWEGAWYAIGYSIIFTADVATHIVNEYRRLYAANEELISANYGDDGIITALATGVFPDYDRKNYHPFHCCPTLPYGVRQLMCENSLKQTRISKYGAYLLPPISLESAINYCEQAPDTMMLYRVRDGLNLFELAQFYQYLLQKNYPQVPSTNMLEFVQSLYF